MGWTSIRAICVLVMAFGISGCTPSQSEQPGAKPAMSDARIESLRADFPGMTQSCVERVRFGGMEAFPNAVDQCFQMTPSQHWAGLWRDEFEGSKFCSAPATQCPDEKDSNNVWLTLGDGVQRPAESAGKLYAVEFVGRKTLIRGHHGHLGVSDHEIIVDKIISITPVQTGQP